MTSLEKVIEQIKKQVQSGRLQGQISKEWGQLLYENIHKALAISRVSCQREQLVCEYDNIIDRSLTKGKSYEKIYEHKGMVVIINDLDELGSYNKKVFFEQTNCN